MVIIEDRTASKLRKIVKRCLVGHEQLRESFFLALGAESMAVVGFINEILMNEFNIPARLMR